MRARVLGGMPRETGKEGGGGMVRLGFYPTTWVGGPGVKGVPEMPCVCTTELAVWQLHGRDLTFHCMALLLYHPHPWGGVEDSDHPGSERRTLSCEQGREISSSVTHKHLLSCFHF